MKNAKFQFFSGGIALNGVCCAVYLNKNSNYVLVAERNGRKISKTATWEMSVADYDDLPHDPYNSLVRLRAALACCGVKV